MGRLPRRPRAALAPAAGLLAFALSGCIAAEPATVDAEPPAPIGPEPPSTTLTLQSVIGIVGELDGSATMAFSPGDSLSSSGADLAAENDYWVGVGGRPDRCAGVVAAPYLVSAADTGSRLDDPSALLGTYTEVDEERFGLVQVYARQFDDAATASGFFSEFGATVAGCPSYQFVDDGEITWNASDLYVAPMIGLSDAVAGMGYVETLRDSPAESVTIGFLQREAVVISVYAELTTSSTITQAQADAIAAAVAERLSRL